MLGIFARAEAGVVTEFFGQIIGDARATGNQNHFVAQIGGFKLPEDLKPGEWRWLVAVDLENLVKTE